jgi:hypothetical protein
MFSLVLITADTNIKANRHYFINGHVVTGKLQSGEKRVRNYPENRRVSTHVHDKKDGIVQSEATIAI